MDSDESWREVHKMSKRANKALSRILNSSKRLRKMAIGPIEFGQSYDGKTTTSHATVRQIIQNLKRTIFTLKNKERRMAPINVFKPIMEKVKGDPKAIKDAVGGAEEAVNNYRKVAGNQVVKTKPHDNKHH